MGMDFENSSITELQDFVRTARHSTNRDAVALVAFANALYWLGNKYSESQRFSDAELAYRESISLRRSNVDGSDPTAMDEIAVALNNLAVCYVDLGNLNAARETWEESIAWYAKIPRTWESMRIISEIYRQLAQLYWAAERLEEGQSSAANEVRYRKLALAELPTNAALRTELAAALYNAAFISSNRSEYLEAEKHLSESVALLSADNRERTEAGAVQLAKHLALFARVKLQLQLRDAAIELANTAAAQAFDVAEGILFQMGVLSDSESDD
jgi:tetratricopeptide (TPR) repeat protein